MLDAKATLDASNQQTRVARITAVALTPTQPPVPFPLVTARPVDLPLGIDDYRPGALHGCDCVFNNHWRGRTNGQYIDVYAGAGGLDFLHLDQGILMVETSTLNLSDHSLDFYLTPIKAGPVHIVSVDGLRLTLLSTDNTQFVFDADTRTWVP